MSRNYRSGQIGLVLLVVLGLVISLVLSIAARSLSDVVLSRQSKENSAAFALAETGVEEALRAIGSDETTSYTGSLSDESGLIVGEYQVQEVDEFDLYVKAGETAEVDLAGYAGSSINIAWTREDDVSENVSCVSEGYGGAPASIEVMVIKSDASVERDYYNTYDCSVVSNGFASSSQGQEGFVSQVEYPLPVNKSYLRIRPYYSGATIKVAGTGLTGQMYLVQSGAEGSDVDKEIEVKRSKESGGSIFDYVLFSGSSIIK